MRREYIFICNLTCLFFFLLSERLFASEESGSDYSKGCDYLRCENGSRCVKRRFWCKNSPCPGMLYCSKSRTESLKGPLTCDTVRCNKGHICIVKVRGCHWDGKCKQQLARCVSEKEYYEGAASCAGFECPSGELCILRETYCVNPPCKLIRSCKSAEDVQTWFDRCKSLNCTSEYECFLRRPENNCLDSWCTHTPDCTLTIEDELISKYCYGWICPPEQKCVVRIIDSCKGFNCTIERSCRPSSVSSAKHNTNNEIAEQPAARRTLAQIERELSRHEKKSDTQTNYPNKKVENFLMEELKIIRKIRSSKLKNSFMIPVTSTWNENIRPTTPTKDRTEISLTQQIATTKSNLITESSESTTSGSYVTLTYPRLNYNKPSTIDEDKVIQSSTSLATLLTDGKTEPTVSRDMKRLEAPRKIYIATDDVLPLPIMLEDINFPGQGYPIWIKNDPYHLLEEDENVWYHASQEPYKILLPPYEPVILVEGPRRQEQFLPFFTNAFDHLFNEAGLTSLPEITSDIEDLKMDSTTIADDKIANYTNGSAITEITNFKTNHSNDSSDDHANFPATEKTTTAQPSISDKELDYDYDEWRPWYMIHDDYLEQKESQTSYEQGSKSSIDLATDYFYGNDTLADVVEMTTRSQITDEKRSRVSEMRYVDGRNKNLATLSPPVSTGQSDYSARNEKLHGLANYPYDTISVHHVGKSSREYGGSSLKRIFDASGVERGRKSAERTSSNVLLREASPHYTRNNNMRSNDRVVYDEYSSHESCDNISGIEMTGS